MGYLFAIISGICMSIQGVMNTRLSEKTGLFLANAYVQGTAFLISVLLVLFSQNNKFRGFSEVNKFYLLGGLFGIIITLTVMLSVKGTSPAVAISSIVISQLVFAALIDAFGLMGTEKTDFGWNKYIGTALMTGGIILFKFRS